MKWMNEKDSHEEWDWCKVTIMIVVTAAVLAMISVALPLIFWVVFKLAA